MAMPVTRSNKVPNNNGADPADPAGPPDPAGPAVNDGNDAGKVPQIPLTNKPADIPLITEPDINSAEAVGDVSQQRLEKVFIS